MDNNQEYLMANVTVRVDVGGEINRLDQLATLRLYKPLPDHPEGPIEAMRLNNREIAHYLRRVADQVERGDL